MDMTCIKLQFCVAAITLLQVTIGNGLRLESGAVCQLPTAIPENHYDCYKVALSQETIGHREEESDVLQLVRPCPTCFPEVQTVRRVWHVPITEERCSLAPIWRRPRTIQQTATGTRILTSRGLLRGSSYPKNLLCVWNVSCGGGEVLYLNVSQQALHIAESRMHSENATSGNYSCSDYLQVVSADNTSVVSCGDEPHPQVVDQIQHTGHVQVVFSSDGSGVGRGVEVDTTCFPSATAQGAEAASSLDQLVAVSCNSTEESAAQYNFLADLFRLHFRLLLVTDACGRGVPKCVNANFTALSAYLRATMEQIMQFEATELCNPLLQSMIEKTNRLLQDYI